MFTFIYVFILFGNLEMILLIFLEAHFLTHKYFFISNLFLVDFGSSSTVTSKVMTGLLTRNNVISYNTCAVPMPFFVVFAPMDSHLLASMAYDHYATVCKPLHYITTMIKVVCTSLAIGSYAFGILKVSIQTEDTFCLHFYTY